MINHYSKALFKNTIRCGMDKRKLRRHLNKAMRPREGRWTSAAYVDVAFQWAASPQGHQFWKEVARGSVTFGLHT